MLSSRSYRLFVALLALGLWPAASEAVEPFPLSQVQPGLVGEGRTVFEGSRIEAFEARVLGVLDNALGPGRSVILARLSGGPLATTGILQGMSGSPVYVDGRLLGAVAYSFPFSKEPIAGITPWEDMLSASPKTPGTHPSPPSETLPRFPLSSRQLDEILAPSPTRPAQPTESQANGALQPLASPLVLSGFSPQAAHWMRDRLGALGLSAATAAGGASSAQPAPDEPPVAPGSPLSVTLIRGDLDVSATGTTTALIGSRVHAFGHAFQNMGPVRLPLRRARVIASIPSVQQSWKASVPLDTVGTFDQDRTTGMIGSLGPGPDMLPVSIDLVTSAGVAKHLSLDVARDETLSPLLVYAALFSVFQTFERARGASTVEIDTRIELSSGHVVRLRDIYADDQPFFKAAGLVAAPMALVVSNSFEPVSVTNIHVEARFAEERRSGTILRAWVESDGPLRGGGEATVHVVLKRHAGPERTVSIPLQIPQGLPAGRYSLALAGADALAAEEQRAAQNALVPRSLPQLVRRINEMRPDSRLYVRLVQPSSGAFVGGERMPALPSTVLAVLGSAEPASPPVPLASSIVWETDVAVDLALGGLRTLSLTVENSL